AKRLAALVIKLDERNERLDDWIAGQDTINQRLTGAVERIDTTLASLHTLMREVFRERTNGHSD
ncbi:hypothetical protein, partial [Glutamicibacter sp.]|uniref:hypothetical protein n=1 Tax=Glutamicibacter sp. TaxID=1931995 RepID=UPI002B47AA89